MSLEEINTILSCVEKDCKINLQYQIIRILPSSVWRMVDDKSLLYINTKVVGFHDLEVQSDNSCWHEYKGDKYTVVSARCSSQEQSNVLYYIFYNENHHSLHNFESLFEQAIAE